MNVKELQNNKKFKNWTDMINDDFRKVLNDLRKIDDENPYTYLSPSVIMAEPKYKIDVQVGDSVKINDGPFKDFDGKIQEIDEERGRVKALVSIFGRETPVELDFLQVKKI